MTDSADLEISLRHDGSPGEAAYEVEFRFSQPDSDVDIRLGQPAVAKFDLVALRATADDVSAYGQALAQSLFADPELLKAYVKARTSAQTLGAPLRIRLLLGPGAADLHILRWETLCDPEDHIPFCTNENIYFSRYLSSTDMRPVRMQPKSDLRALVVAANPSDLGDYDLGAINVEEEIQRAQAGLGAIPVHCLPDSAAGLRASLDSMIDGLRWQEDGRTGVDILYLVCHGTLQQAEPILWMEGPDGKSARVKGSELVEQIRLLEQRPRLVVLASCQSAGAGAGDALSALGPRLAEAGIPAVVAMQGNVTLETISGFMPAFFEELKRDGQIDRALAVARGKVRGRPDFWMPVLYMRLKSGRLWYVPGFGEDQEDFEKWQSLVSFIQEGLCTPILGPGLLEPLIGSQREIALAWADKHGYPLAPYDRDVLPRVAQYVVTRLDPMALRISLRELLRDRIIKRYASILPDELRNANVWLADRLLKAMQVVAEKRWESGPEEAHMALAKLRLPIYITADITNSLALALTKLGADPQVRLCPWNNRIPQSKCLYEDAPTPEKPLVYHLFGHLSEPNSLVLTEDEYFDYLIGITSNKSLIPSAVRAALASTGLLFLGFNIDDWDFRVLFRSLMAQEGGDQRKYYSHVAAQIEPDENRILDPKRARQFLEKYFETEKISIFWGSSEEFLAELTKQIQAATA